MSREYVVLSGAANPQLAHAIARELDVPMTASVVGRFPDGETSVRLLQSVRGKSVFLIQPTAPPVNDHLVELLAFSDACRRASAAEVSAVIPYFGYARADKRQGQGEPITASMVARLLQTVGIGHVITLDLHASQIEGFFQIPVDSLTAVPLLCEAVVPHLPANSVVVAPDTGRLGMATEYAQRLGTSVVVLHKVRASGRDTQVLHVVGDVRGRTCLVIDDMISTGGTLADGIHTLVAAGARPPMFVATTHGLLLQGSRARLATEAIAKVFVTDTVRPVESGWTDLQVVSVAPLLADAVRRVASAVVPAASF